MNESLYIAASGMSAVQRMLDSSTHNTVNSQTPGYQNRLMVLKNFGAFLDRAGDRDELVGAEEVVRFDQGDLRPSAEPFAFALQGDGFFNLRGDDGRSLYTRNGDFLLNREGMLVTRAGYEVLSDTGSPIQIKLEAGPVAVDVDGRIYQDGAGLGRLGIYEFPEERRQELKAVSETIFAAHPELEGKAAEATTVHQGFLEYAKHGGMKGLVQMMLANKNYEAMQRAVKGIDAAQDSMIKSIQ